MKIRTSSGQSLIEYILVTSIVATLTLGTFSLLKKFIEKKVVEIEESLKKETETR